MKTKYIKIGAWGETIKKDSPIGTLNLNKLISELSDKTIKLFDTVNDFPNTGNSENLYLDESTGILYKWYNNQYQSLNPTTTSNRTYIINRPMDDSLGIGNWDEQPNINTLEISNPQQGDFAIITRSELGFVNRNYNAYSTWVYNNNQWEAVNIIDKNQYTKGNQVSKLYIKAWIDTGAYDVITGSVGGTIVSMSNYYSVAGIGNGLITSNSPFDSNGLNWEINDDNINTMLFDTSLPYTPNPIDWVLIRFYKEKGTQVEFTKTGLLLPNGNIVGMDGVSPILISEVGTYYIGIKTRASLEAITWLPFTFPNDRLELDFTSNSVAIVGDTTASSTLPYNNAIGKYCLIMGDLNDDKIINSEDVDLVQGASGIGDDYENAAGDLNLDGNVDSTDMNIINGNLGSFLHW